MTRTKSKKSNLRLIQTEPEVTATVQPESFDDRLKLLENELKDGLARIEERVAKLADKRLSGDAHLLKDDIDRLTKLVEERLRKNLSQLRDEILPPDQAETDAIRRWTRELAGILGLGSVHRALSQNKTTNHDVDDFGLDPEFVAAIKPVFDYLYYKYWRVSVSGIENIPNEGRALIVGNHSGGLPYDGAMLKAAILNEHPVRDDARFLVEDFVYHMPFLGTQMYRIGGVRACPENAQKLLESGHLVVVFPEGVKGIGKYYHQRYQLQRFGRGGFVKLCQKTRSPLIPVGIVGAEEIHPILYKSNTLAKAIGVPYLPITPTFPLLGPLGLIPLPSKWAIRFGKPIEFDDRLVKTLEDEIEVHKLSEHVRGEIQSILIGLLKERRSVWFG